MRKLTAIRTIFVFIVTIVSYTSFFVSPSLGQNDDWIFWGKSSDTSLMRAEVTGANVTQLADLNYTPYDIDLDETAKKAYWVDNATCNVTSIPFNGGSTTLSAAFNWKAIGLSLDEGNSKMYVSTARDLGYAPILGWMSGIQQPDSADPYYEGGVFRAPISAGTSTSHMFSPISANALKSGTGNISVDATGGKLYWSVGSAVMRANLDGSSPESVLITGKRVTDVAVDSTRGRLYTARTATHVFREDVTMPLYGSVYQSDTTGTTDSQIYAGGPLRGQSLRKVAVDKISGDVYVMDADWDNTYFYSLTTLSTVYQWNSWEVDPTKILDFQIDGINSFAYVGTSNTGIYQISLDGASSNVFVPLTVGTAPVSIALDTSGSKLYWLQANREVHSINFDGTGSQLLFTIGSAGTSVLGIDLNVVAGKIYWLQNTPAAIYRADVDGTNQELLISETFSGDQEFVVDSLTNRVYFISERGIERQNFDGTGRTLLFSTSSSNVYLRIDTTNNRMFWYSRTDNYIYYANLDGSSDGYISSTIEPSAPLLIDPITQKLYWSDNNLLYRANYDGTNIESTDVYYPISSIGFGPSNTVFVLNGSFNDADSSLYSVSRSDLTTINWLGYAPKINYDRVSMFVDTNDDIYYFDNALDSTIPTGLNRAPLERYIVKLAFNVGTGQYVATRHTLHRYFNGNPMYWDAAANRIYWSTSAGIYWDNKSDLYDLLLQTSPLGVAYPGVLVTHANKIYPDTANTKIYRSTGVGGTIIESSYTFTGPATIHSGGVMTEDVFFSAGAPSPSVYWADSSVGGTGGLWNRVIGAPSSTQLLTNAIAGRPFGVAVYDRPLINQWQVSGVVTLETVAVSGQSVDAGGINGTTSTDISGAYSFTLDEGTAVSLSTARPGYVFSEVLGRPLSFSLVGDTVRNLDGTANRISGTVRWATPGQEPAAGVTVTDGTRSAVSDLSGLYELVAVPNGVYNVSGTLATYTVYLDPGVNPVTISDGSASVNLWVQPKYSVSGSVTLEGLPVVGQVVDGGVAVGTTTTDSSGNYSFSNIPSGTSIALSLTRAGYVFTESLGRSLSFTLSQNEVRSFNGIANRISGTAKWATPGQEPAAGVTVTDGTRSGVTNGSGFYELVAVPNGNYDVSGSLPTYTVYLDPGVSPVTINNGSAAVNLWVQPKYSVGGSVSLEGQPTDGQTVEGGVDLGSELTDSSGTYNFANVPSGTSVALSVTRPGYVFTESLGRSLSFTLSQNEVRSFNGIANRISGTAKWATPGQEPAAGVTVTDGTRSAVTNTSGFYELVAVPNGSYTVSGTYPTYTVYVDPGVNPVSINNGSTSVNLWVEPKVSLHKISGHVKWANSAEEPVSGAVITDGTRSSTSNSVGYYELLAVPSGTYTVTGSFGTYRVEAEQGQSPVTVSAQDEVVDLWVYPEVSPVVLAPWNGFLDVTAIAEVINVGTEPLGVVITLYRMDGNNSVGLPGKVRASLEPGQQRDFVLNAMDGFEQDLYGIVKLEFDHSSYNGRVIYYKPKGVAPRSWKENYFDDFDYVFVNPFVGPVSGSSFVSFNTYQPSMDVNDSDHLVPNWLTLINADNAATQYFRIRKYDESGEIISPTSTVGTVQEVCKVVEDYLRCKVNPMGRIDIDGGHVLPGPNRAGQIDIEPENLDAQYTANLIRYGMNAPPTTYTRSYSFGSYFQTRSGSNSDQIVPVWRIGGADSWVEVSNVLHVAADVTVRYYDYQGNELAVISERLQPKQTKHFEASRYLGAGDVGIARIESSTPQSLVAQVAVYYRDAVGGMTAMLAVQGREPFSHKIFGTYNTFLSAYNYLKIVNLTDVKRTLKLTVGTETKTIVLSPRGGLDLALNDGLFTLDANTLGVVTLEDVEPGRVFSQVIRVKPSSERTYDFIVATDVE